MCHHLVVTCIGGDHHHLVLTVYMVQTGSLLGPFFQFADGSVDVRAAGVRPALRFAGGGD